MQFINSIQNLLSRNRYSSLSTGWELSSRWWLLVTPHSCPCCLKDWLRKVAQNTFDILGGILYILCVFIEGGIFISHLIWRFRTRKIRAQAKAEEKTFDDIAEERRRENVEFQFAEREVKLPFFRSKPGGPGPMEAGNMKGESLPCRRKVQNCGNREALKAYADPLRRSSLQDEIVIRKCCWNAARRAQIMRTPLNRDNMQQSRTRPLRQCGESFCAELYHGTEDDRWAILEI